MVRALAFDVFGTVVDWRGSIVAEGEERWEPRGVHADWAALADAWRRRYQPSLERVRAGRREWAPLDELHRESLDDLLPELGLERLGERDRAELNLVWHRLKPWPDSREGLRRLAQRFTLATLSNGNVALLEDLARNALLPFHRVLSAETFQAYKPDPRTYTGAARILGVQPEELMMVAAHTGDLRAAAASGLRTAFVARPLEWGPAGRAEEPDADFDVVAGDLDELADRLLEGRPG